MLDSPVRNAPFGSKRGGEGLVVRPKLVNLNLIPIEFRRPLVTKPRLLMLTAILTGALAFPRVYVAQVEVSSKADGLRQQVETLILMREAEGKRIATEKMEAVRLGQEIDRLAEEVALRNSRASVETQILRRIDLAPALEVALTSEPAGLEVTSVRWQEPGLTIEGRTRDVPTVMSYTRKLQESGRFRDQRLRVLETVNDKTEPGPKPAPGVASPEANRGLAFILELELATGAAS